jgi:hypothetical protein
MVPKRRHAKIIRRGYTHTHNEQYVSSEQLLCQQCAVGLGNYSLTLCSNVPASSSLSRVNSRARNPEDGVGKFLRNLGKQLPKHTAQLIRRRGLSIRKKLFVTGKTFRIRVIISGYGAGCPA